MGYQTEETETAANSSEDGKPDLDALFDCLADSTRRQILRLLYERAPNPVTRRDLAIHLAPDFDSDPLEQDSKREFQRVFTALEHAHLPKLDDAGLITQDPDRELVELSAHPALDDPRVIAAIRDEAGTESRSLDVVFAALSHSRRRAILGLLHGRSGPVQRENLARELGAVKQDVPESNVSTATVDRLQAMLHHAHLPSLSRAGLIEYDSQEREVVAQEYPELTKKWIPTGLEV